MRGVYLGYLPSSSEGGKRKLVARIEDHVSRTPRNTPVCCISQKNPEINEINMIYGSDVSRDHTPGYVASPRRE